MCALPLVSIVRPLLLGTFENGMASHSPCCQEGSWWVLKLHNHIKINVRIQSENITMHFQWLWEIFPNHIMGMHEFAFPVLQWMFKLYALFDLLQIRENSKHFGVYMWWKIQMAPSHQRTCGTFGWEIYLRRLYWRSGQMLWHSFHPFPLGLQRRCRLW